MAGEWREISLRKLFSVKHGFAFKGEHFTDEPQEYALVTPGNFAIGGGFQDLKRKYYNGPVPHDFVLKAGQVVVTMTDLSKEADTLGYAAVVPSDSITWLHNQRVGLLEFSPDTPACPRFVQYLLRTHKYRSWIVGSATGTTVKHTSPGRIEAYTTRIPPIDEQRAIAQILGTLDDKIELNRRMNETLEAIAQAIFKSWFVDFDPVRAKASGEPSESICHRLRLTPDILALFPDRLVDSELGEIPEGWLPQRVDHFLELAYGKALNATARIAGSVPVYGSGGVTGSHNEHLVDGPGVIVGRKGTVGSLFWEDRSFYPIDTVFYVVPKVELTFCFYVLQTLGLDRMNTDAAVPGLNRSNVYRLLVASPPAELRKEFARLVTPMRARMFANAQESQLLAMIRDTLLPKLLSGELRVAIGGVT